MSLSLKKIDEYISLALRWKGWITVAIGAVGVPAWAVFVRFVEIPPHWIYLGGLACWACTATAANQISALMERRRNPLPKLRMIGFSQSGTCAYAEILNESATVPLNEPVARIEVRDGGKKYTVNHLRWGNNKETEYIQPGCSALVNIACEHGGILIVSLDLIERRSNRVPFLAERTASSDQIKAKLTITGTGGVWTFPWMTVTWNKSAKRIDLS